MTFTEITLDDVFRIFGKITVDEASRCWIYSDSEYMGYRNIYLNGDKFQAHRFFFELFQEHLPENFSDLVVHHQCFNKKCVNPFHLEATTCHMNTLLSQKNVNARKTLLGKLIVKVRDRSSDGCAIFTSTELKNILGSNQKSGNNFLSTLKGMKTVYDGHFDYWKCGKLPGDCGRLVNSYAVSLDLDFIEQYKANQGEFMRYIEHAVLPASFFSDAR